MALAEGSVYFVGLVFEAFLRDSGLHLTPSPLAILVF